MEGRKSFCHDMTDGLPFSSSGPILQSPIILTLRMSNLMSHHASIHQLPNPCPLTTFNQSHVSSMPLRTSTVKSHTSRSPCTYPVPSRQKLWSSKSYIYIYSILQTPLSRLSYRSALQSPLKIYPQARINTSGSENTIKLKPCKIGVSTT